MPKHQHSPESATESQQQRAKCQTRLSSKTGHCEAPISRIAMNQEGLNSEPSAHGVTLIDPLCLGASSQCLAGISQQEFSCKMESIR